MLEERLSGAATGAKAVDSTEREANWQRQCDSKAASASADEQFWRGSGDVQSRDSSR
jgi:hypothetical protein